jgi:hypothetical protein
VFPSLASAIVIAVSARASDLLPILPSHTQSRYTRFQISSYIAFDSESHSVLRRSWLFLIVLGQISNGKSIFQLSFHYSIITITITIIIVIQIPNLGRFGCVTMIEWELNFCILLL